MVRGTGFLGVVETVDEDLHVAVTCRKINKIDGRGKANSNLFPPLLSHDGQADCGLGRRVDEKGRGLSRQASVGGVVVVVQLFKTWLRVLANSRMLAKHNGCKPGMGLKFEKSSLSLGLGYDGPGTGKFTHMHNISCSGDSKSRTRIESLGTPAARPRNVLVPNSTCIRGACLQHTKLRKHLVATEKRSTTRLLLALCNHDIEIITPS